VNESDGMMEDGIFKICMQKFWEGESRIETLFTFGRLLLGTEAYIPLLSTSTRSNRPDLKYY